MYLSKIMHSFKSSVTRDVRRDCSDITFGWQNSFFDHIIRDDKSLYKIRKYIRENPIRWMIDKNNNI